ncbi:uncharacterized protein LOC5564426 [Aedes aegypti]|uniref:CHK kinase-like domain-containing protein n=1 Tax=Aedes aegypti TaxID=7159 RepID=A0A1S4G2C9_AEDAE|nr:uncharacterized protein LOC5564426 [Aedes aegypti]
MSEYDADELQAPVWLNDSFLEHAVQNFEKDSSIKIINGCELRPATKGGDHYASIMFRTTVRYRSERQLDEKTLKLVIKAQPTAEGFKKELTKDNSLFGTEIKMYSEILPAMKKLLEDAGERMEFPRLIYAATNPNAVIMLEDIAPYGWLPGRTPVRSFEEVLFTVRNIAKFHATSLYLQQSTMDLSGFNVDQFWTSGPVFAIFSRGFDELCSGLAAWPECAVYVEKFRNLKDSFQERCQQVFAANPPSEGYNVLNHADFQFKNLMHKKDSEDRIVDSMLIDFQCCHWGSPAIDVLSLVDLIVDMETKMAHRNEIIYEYYQHFAMILRKIGYTGKIPSLVDLQVELLRKGFQELVHTAVESFKYADLTESTFDDYNAGNLDINKCYIDKSFLRFICTELESLLYRGLLEAE